MERLWECEDCSYQTEWSYDQLAEQGGPVCPNCDNDMELLPPDLDSPEKTTNK